MLRELVKTSDNDLRNKVKLKIESAREELSAYESLTEHEANFNESRQLVTLLTEKTDLQYKALNSYVNNQVNDAEEMISSPTE